jgi:hypothetical protein
MGDPSRLLAPKLLGSLGGIALAAGAAAPLIHIPIFGSISYLHHPAYWHSCSVGESLLLSAAVLSFVFAFFNRFKPLWVTGTAALAQLMVTLVTFHSRAAAMIAEANKADLVDPMVMWTGAALRDARFEWGIAVITVGGAMLIAAGHGKAARGVGEDKAVTRRTSLIAI